jgi:predicted transporter
MNAPNSHNAVEGFFGTVLSVSMAIVSNLEQVEMTVRIIAGIIAIIAGIYTARYYHFKTKKLRNE